MSLPLLHHDDAIVVVNKPSGLVVHRGWATDDVTLVRLVQSQLGKKVYPAHRLDRGTSGALVFALSPEVAARMGQRFAEGGVSKRYLALVRGKAPDAVLVDHAIASEHGKPKRPAQTHVSRLFSHPLLDEETGIERLYSWVEARPLTGRAHQVRRHLKHISHPIIGDVRYGKSQHNKLFRRRFGLERMALHAERVCFAHPVNGEAMEIVAPLPQELASVWTALSAPPLSEGPWHESPAPTP